MIRDMRYGKGPKNVTKCAKKWYAAKFRMTDLFSLSTPRAIRMRLYLYRFLFLLDSVSRARGMGLQHIVRRLHSQSVSQLSENQLNAFLSNFSSRLPWDRTKVEWTLLK